MAQQYSTSVLRDLWCNYEGRGDEFSGCSPPGRWADPWFMGRPIGGVPLVLVDAFDALEMALTDAGYDADSVWAYNKRPIAGTSSWSLHSYGVAIDLDPLKNGFTAGDPYAGKMKQHHVDAVLAIRTTSGRRLWAWGGNWSTPDRMHYQIDNKPADTAVDWSTVPGFEEDEMQDADWDKLRTIVREEIDKEFTQRLKMDDANTNAISRGVWQHKGENQDKSLSTMTRATYNAVTK